MEEKSFPIVLVLNVFSSSLIHLKLIISALLGCLFKYNIGLLDSADLDGEVMKRVCLLLTGGLDL